MVLKARCPGSFTSCNFRGIPRVAVPPIIGGEAPFRGSPYRFELMSYRFAPLLYRFLSGLYRYLSEPYRNVLKPYRFGNGHYCPLPPGHTRT